MTTLDAVWRGLQDRGFKELKGRGRKEPPVWRKILDEVIYWDVRITESSWNAHHFGCSISVAYHPRARDTWGDEEPFLIFIREHDLTPSGLKEIGTPGASSWPFDAGSNFLDSLDTVFSAHFSTCTTRGQLLGESISQLAAFPKRNSLRLAIAFLQFELGELEAARTSFDLYLGKFPHLQKLIGPLIDKMFEGK